MITDDWRWDDRKHRLYKLEEGGEVVYNSTATFDRKMIAQRLRERRKHANHSQRALGALARLVPQTVLHVEQGRGTSMSTLSKLATALDLDLLWLLFGETDGVRVPTPGLAASKASRLKMAREARGFSQNELSKLSGVPQGSISRYESGAVGISEDVAHKLADPMRVRVGFLLGKSDEMEKNDVLAARKAIQKATLEAIRAPRTPLDVSNYTEYASEVTWEGF